MSGAGTKKIYLGNLPYSASEEDILKFLELRDEREAFVELITDRDDPGRRLGFGFATVPVEREADVLAMDGQRLNGRTVKVAPARQKQPRY